MGAIYQDAPNRKLRAENNFKSGINTGDEPFGVGFNQSIVEVGFDTDDHPFISSAKSSSAYGASGAAQVNLLANFNNAHLVRACGTALSYNSTGTTWTAIAGVFADASWDSTMFEVGGAQALVLVNGTDVAKFWNGSALANLGGTPPVGSFICNDTIRLWIAREDILYFSANLDGQDWSTAEDSGLIEYYTSTGGNITALKNFYSDKYIWKKDSMAVIQGTDYFNFRLSEISNDIGCVSSKTIQEVGDTLFWLGQNDVYAFKGGAPVPIGQPVRSYLDSINKTHWTKCCAITDGIRYYLCLVTGVATEPDVRLVYDPRYNIWRVPAEDENYRYAARINNVAYVGNSSGQIYTFNNAASGALQSWSITSRPFDEGAGETEKMYKELHVQGYFPTGTTLTAAISTTDRGDDFVSIDYDPTTADSEAQNRNMMIPLDTTELAYWMRFRLSGTGPVTLYNIQRYFRTMRTQH